MVLKLAERSTLIAPSATLAMAAEARRLKGQGVDVLDFALGEPDFDTPRTSRTPPSGPCGPGTPTTRRPPGSPN